MKTKINYRNRASQFSRQNGFKAWLFSKAFGLSGIFRIPIEVHTRSQFGERYFSFSSSLFTLFLACFYPKLVHFFTTNPFQNMYGQGETIWQMFLHNFLLYAYLIYTGYVCWLHQKQKKARPSVFDFGLYTKSTGILDTRITNIRFDGRSATLREIETFFEPLLFFVPGVLLMLMGQSLGGFLVLCSVIYALGYCAAYKNGDDRMMDIIDDDIIQSELINVIVLGKLKAQTKGYQFYGGVSDDPHMRQKAADAMAEDADFEEVK